MSTRASFTTTKVTPQNKQQTMRATCALKRRLTGGARLADARWGTTRLLDERELFPRRGSWNVRVYWSAGSKATCRSAKESHERGFRVNRKASLVDCRGSVGPSDCKTA